MAWATGVAELAAWGTLVYAFAVLVVPMHRDEGWPLAALDAGYALAMGTAAALALPVGRAIDAWGARTVLLTGSVVGAATLAAWSRVGSPLGFDVVCVGLGAAMATGLYEPAFALVATRVPERRSQALLVVTTVAGFASVVFLPLVGRLAAADGWRGATRILAVLVLAVGLAAYGLVVPADASGPRARTAAGAVRVPGAIWHLGSLRYLFISFGLGALGRTAVTVGLVAYLAARGYPLPTAAAVGGVIGLAQVGGRLLIGLRVPPAGSAGVTALLLAVQGAAVVLFVLLGARDALPVAAAVAFAVVFGIAAGPAEMVRGEVVGRYYGEAAYGQANGALALGVTGARALAPLLDGAAYAVAASYAPAFLVAAALLPVSGAALWLAGREAARERVPGTAAPPTGDDAAGTGLG